LEALQERQKRSNRLTPFDLMFMVDTSTQQPCLQVIRSYWDTGISQRAQNELEASQAALRLAAVTDDVAQGPSGNMWHPNRGKGNRLSLLPAFNSHRLLLHATALRFSAEQTSATCAAAAAAAAWNICCAPQNGCDIALGLAPQESVLGHSAAVGPSQCEHQAVPLTCSTQAATRTAAPLVGTQSCNCVEQSCSAEASKASLTWPLFEKDVMAVYAEQEKSKVSCTAHKTVQHRISYACHPVYGQRPLTGHSTDGFESRSYLLCSASVGRCQHEWLQDTAKIPPYC
jgi:hypothetical protein